MADNIKLVTYSGSTVTPLDDALVYEKAIGQSGIIYGAEITLKNTNTLHINAGHGVICGRKFTIVDSDIPVQLTAGTTNPGRVYIHLDLSNTTEPIQIMTEVAATLAAPIQQEDVNINNGVYEFNMATFTIDAQTISEVVNIFPSIENTTGNLSDLTTEDKSSLVAAVNEINKKEVSVLDTGEEIMANTASNKAAGAKGVKELFTEVSDSLGGLQFGIDENGNYGYIKAGADTVTPFSSGNYLTAENTDHTSNTAHSLSLNTQSISNGILVVYSTIQATGANGSVNISGATIEETIVDNTGFYSTNICFLMYKLKDIADTLTVTQTLTANVNNRDLKIVLIY